MYYETNELYHYGVPGMRWGHRKASKLQNRAKNARESAAEWDEMARLAKAKGKINKANKYKQNANEDRADAAKYQQKAEKKVGKKFARAGMKIGRADYEKELGDAAYKKHADKAKVLDKIAKKSEAEGKFAKAEMARSSAAKLRARGENVRAGHYEAADRYLKRGEKLNKKASEFSASTNVNLGKKKVDSIIKSSRQKGYEKSRQEAEFQKEERIRSRFGDDGVDAYRFAKGTY